MRRVRFVILFCVISVLAIQSQTMVYLVHSETLNFDEERLPDAQILKGNVCFRHEDALMYCDSAYFYEKDNSLDAFSHIRFVQGDTLQGFGDVLHYDGNTKFAKLRKHVKLIHKNTILTTDSLNYNRVADLAYYFTGGKIEDDVNVLTSRWGQYKPSTNQAIFSKDVHLTNTSFLLDTDTLWYNTKTNIANLVSPTTIVYDKETRILSSKGWYNTSNEKSMLLARSQVLHSDGKQMTGDTIMYDKRAGYGQVVGKMELRDTVQKSTLYGNYGEYYDKEERGYATDSALLVDWSNDTSYTFIHADTLFMEQVPGKLYFLSEKDSIFADSVFVTQQPDTVWKDTMFRQIKAYHNVRVYNRDYQLVSDSLTYNGKDSVVTLYHLPICWNGDNQISADTIFIYLKNGEVDYAKGEGNALAIKREAINYYDQMGGKEMIAYVRDGELTRVDVNGNAETIFFPKEEDGSFVGVNKTQSSFVKLYLVDQKVEHVLFTSTTTGVLYPLEQIADGQMFLQGFFWAENERPASILDVFRCPEHTIRPEKSIASVIEPAEDEEQSTIIRRNTNRNKREKK